MAMVKTPAASVVLMRVITISNGDDAASDSERGADGGDHYQRLR